MQLWRLLVAPLAALSLSLAANAKSSTGSSVLVVLESQLDRANFSTFFSGLESRGFELTFRAPKDEKPLIIKDDVPAFSHVIVFAPNTKTFAKDLEPQTLVSLLSQNVNILFALSDSPSPINTLASEFSLILPPPGTPLLSHFPAREGPATTLPVPVPASHPILTSNLPPVLFSGVPFSLGLNPLLVPILNAPPESFASDGTSDNDGDALFDASDRGGEGLWAGSSLSVVAGFQVLGGSRALFVGGYDMFTDEFANKDVSKGVKSGNKQFCSDISEWVFQESMVLRIDSSSHHRVNETETPEKYTTSDMIEYTTHISKYDSVSGTWKSHYALNDLQLEFTMLDPHIRTRLAPVPGSAGDYSVTFRAPDRHGVFKFVVDYKRKGWTHLHSAITVPVVPPRHDGYPRFLSAAWPYYAGAISTSVAFFIFSFLWLTGAVERDERKKKSGKTE